MDSIRFGTSGWRGIIAQDFTFANVTLVAQAIATYLKRELKRKKSPIYGRQPKIYWATTRVSWGLSSPTQIAEVLAENGLQPLMCQRDAPTQSLRMPSVKNVHRWHQHDGKPQPRPLTRV